MQCFLTYFTFHGGQVEGGHMAWVDANEAVNFARVMGYGIDIRPCESGPAMCAVQAGIREGFYDKCGRVGDGDTGLLDRR